MLGKAHKTACMRLLTRGCTSFRQAEQAALTGEAGNACPQRPHFLRSAAQSVPAHGASSIALPAKKSLMKGQFVKRSTLLHRRARGTTPLGERLILSVFRTRSALSHRSFEGRLEDSPWMLKGAEPRAPADPCDRAAFHDHASWTRLPALRNATAPLRWARNDRRNIMAAWLRSELPD